MLKKAFPSFFNLGGRKGVFRILKKKGGVRPVGKGRGNCTKGKGENGVKEGQVGMVPFAV